MPLNKVLGVWQLANEAHSWHSAGRMSLSVLMLHQVRLSTEIHEQMQPSWCLRSVSLLCLSSVSRHHIAHPQTTEEWGTSFDAFVAVRIIWYSLQPKGTKLWQAKDVNPGEVSSSSIQELKIFPRKTLPIVSPMSWSSTQWWCINSCWEDPFTLLFSQQGVGARTWKREARITHSKLAAVH
jgi:hypothetical protein